MKKHSHPPKKITKSKKKGTRNKWTLPVLAGGIALVLALGVLLQPVVAHTQGNTHISEYMQANWNSKLARGIPYPSRTEPIVLRGSWFDMGRQYGEKAGSYIRITYDGYYGLFSLSQLDPTKLGSVIDMYTEESKKFSPQMVEFIRGISEGAAPQLNTADNANALTNMQKVMLLNCLFEIVLPSAWSHVAELMNLPAPQASTEAWEPFASHGWAVWDDMTRGHAGIVGGTRDQPWFPTLYNVAYVAVPSDRKAAVTWSNTIAGLVVASAQVNEHGFGMANTIVSHKQQYFGVPQLIVTGHASFFAHNAHEAANIFTIGTPEYRQMTGRKTLATTVGLFTIVADANKAFVVERTGRNYAIRTAGDQQERSDYTVLPNHSIAHNSFDELAQPTGQPMVNWTLPSAPDSSTWSRYWALFHEFDKQIGRNNKAKVDVKFGQKVIAPLKHTYTPDGQKVTEKNGIPVWRLGLTPERWTIPNPADPNSLPTGGNNMYFVADLKKLEVNWIQGIPSHWEGKWEQISLRDFRKYR